VRRLVVAFLAVPICLLLAVGPVAADTSPNGTNFSSSSSSCTTSGSRQVCTDIFLSVFSNEDGSDGPPCLQISKYSFSANGRFTPISDEFGCAAGSDTVTIGTDLSVAISPTQIPLDSCNRRTCTSSRTVTVSANDSPTGPISTTVTRSTTRSGNCTTKSTTTDQFAELAGTMTVDGTVFDETGFIDIFTTTETTHCR
jgi:hypothetical protein